MVHVEKLSAIGKLSASIAHEFNNPICGIKSALQTVAEYDLDDDVNEVVEISIRECYRMADLVRKLQDFNRPSSGVISFVNLHEVIDDILLLSKKELKESNIVIEKNYYDHLPLIKAVYDQIKQVFLNMVQNAEEAIVNGYGKITITTKKVNSYAVVDIKDTGCGIPLEFMSKIFDPFITTKPLVKSTGLGLSVCHGIVKRFGGNIEVKSEENKGTTFSVIFPLEGDTQ